MFLIRRYIIEELQERVNEFQKMIDKLEVKSESIFNDAHVNLTSLVSKPAMGEFKRSFKNKNNYFIPSFIEREIKYKPKFNPAFIGTATDILISYKLNEEYEFERARVFAKIQKDSPLWFKVYTEAHYTIMFRNPFSIGGLIEQRENIEVFKDDFMHIEKLVDEQIKEFNIKEKIIYNPIFGSKESGVSADGDFIIGKTLYEVKTSINPQFVKKYVNQLMGYIALNESLKEKFDIDSIGYWNPLYGIFYSTRVDYLEPMLDIFNKEKNIFVNDRVYYKNRHMIKKELDKVQEAIDNNKNFKKKELLQVNVDATITLKELKKKIN